MTAEVYKRYTLLLELKATLIRINGQCSPFTSECIFKDKPCEYGPICGLFGRRPFESLQLINEQLAQCESETNSSKGATT